MIMKRGYAISIYIFFWFFVTQSDGFLQDYFNYFAPKKERIEDEIEIGVNILPIVPYELAEKDERFLQEAAKYIGATMSKLDRCHHRVIMSLKESCHNLNSETLGKLSVMLLNCQSHAEGRPIYECTDTMTLKECTIHMDPDTWNAYHLITNRAKAICSAVRQDQFRGLTEITVNKLMQTAHDQIYMMDKLTENNEKLQDSMTTAMNDMTNRNERLINQQQDIMKLSDEHRATVETSLEEIKSEKGLIKAGQLEIADIISKLKHKLDENMNNLKMQFAQTKTNHAELVKDLDELYRSAVRISEKLTETTELVLSQTELASGQFDITMKQLESINNTIFELAKLMDHIQNHVDEKLNWILNRIGGTDTFIKMINVVLIHLGYLLLGMLIIVFVNASKFYRIVFIAAISINFGAILFDVYTMNMLTFTIILFSIFSGNFIRCLFLDKYLKTIVKINTDQKSIVINHNHTGDEPDHHIHANNNTISSHLEKEAHVHRWLLNNNLDCSRSDTPFSSSFTNRIRCTATTIKGIKCRNAANDGSLYCRTHFRSTSHTKMK